MALNLNFMHWDKRKRQGGSDLIDKLRRNRPHLTAVEENESLTTQKLICQANVVGKYTPDSRRFIFLRLIFNNKS